LTFTTDYKCLNVTTSLSYDTACAAVAAANLASGDKAIESRQFDITLTGQLVSDAAVTKTLNGTVKVRNDRIFTQ
jgi:type IV pilus assembly protein PilW